MTVDDALADIETMAASMLDELKRSKALLADSMQLIGEYEALVKRLEAQIDALKRENGKLRLLADLKDDIVRLQ